MRSPALAFFVALSALLLPAPAAAQVPIATFDPGPYAVGVYNWDFGSVAVSPVIGSNPLSVNHFGTVRYPATASGAIAPGPFPFVVWAHGRFQSGAFIGTNHLQASYLLDHLASWGFIVASVNLDVVGQFANPPAITQRGELIHHTIDAFELLDPDGIFIDWEHIALAGHSRGGEGAVDALANNPQKHAIGAVATIAPTDFGTQAPSGVVYLGIYGSKDGDVNNGWPIKIYDRARMGDKVFEYVEGANHFWFTDSISFSGEGNGLITRSQHHDVARTTIARFLRSFASGASFADLCDGAALFPITDDISMHPMYSDQDALVVNDFEGWPVDPTKNSLGLTTVPWLLKTATEQVLAQPFQTFYHQTKAGWIEYDNLGGALLPFHLEELFLGTDVSGFSHLSLRALQKLDSPLNTPDQAIDLRVAVVDSDGEVAVRLLSEFGTIPWPITHVGFQFPEKSVLRTTRIPLAALVQNNPAIDLTRIDFIALAFDQTPTGELRIDDIAFTD